MTAPETSTVAVTGTPAAVENEQDTDALAAGIQKCEDCFQQRPLFLTESVLVHAWTEKHEECPGCSGHRRMMEQVIVTWLCSECRPV